MKKIRRPKKRTPQQKKRELINKIHNVMRDIAIKIHPYCVCCGAEDVLQGGHFIPTKASSNVRFDLINVNTQCSRCNLIHRSNTMPYVRWFLDYYGRQAMDELAEKAKTTKSWKMYELENILIDRKNYLKGLK